MSIWELPKVLGDKRLPESLRHALNELWRWYESAEYTIPVTVEPQDDRVVVQIYYSIEKEVERCTRTCIKDEKCESDKHCRKKCHDECLEDISRGLDSEFDSVLRKMHEVLKKYGIRYRFWGSYAEYERRTVIEVAVQS